MERDCESELSKLNIEQNACIYHFGASVIHGQRSNILRLHYWRFWKVRETYLETVVHVQTFVGDTSSAIQLLNIAAKLKIVTVITLEITE